MRASEHVRLVDEILVDHQRDLERYRVVELTKVETKINEEGHPVFADEALYASVSISIDGMTAVLVKAANNAA